jgi:hypothetical protein
MVRPGMKDMMLAALLSDVGGKDLEEVCRRLDEFAGHDYSDLPLATAASAWQRAATLGSRARLPARARPLFVGQRQLPTPTAVPMGLLSIRLSPVAAVAARVGLSVPSVLRWR